MLRMFPNAVSSLTFMKPLKPRRLSPGDLIGIVAPASPLSETSRLNKSVRYLESIGYRVKVGRNVGARHGYLAGTDRQRRSDLHEMFRDPRVRAVFAVRGGYGTLRILPEIDYAAIRRAPKILVGFSDITALQMALWTRCRMVTFHGPMPGVDMPGSMHPQVEEQFWRMLTSPTATPRLAFSRNNAFPLRRGTATGRLLGGNLSVLASMAGSDFIPDFRRALVFLEDVGEEPYRIDRLLTQLMLSGVLSKASGVIYGQFVDCLPSGTGSSRSAAQVLDDSASRLRVPVLANAAFGHQSVKLTIPVGCRARLRAGSGVIDLLESPVL